MSRRRGSTADKVWGPAGLPPQRYTCTVCSAQMPAGCRASKCATCLSTEIHAADAARAGGTQ